METDDEEIGVGIREQEQDARQILFQSLVLNLLTETIFEVWNIRATGTQGIGHYTILLDKSTHLYTCLFLINKGWYISIFFKLAPTLELRPSI